MVLLLDVLLDGRHNGAAMGDENTVLDSSAARHFLRRTGFGALPEEISEFTGLTRGQAADLRLGFKRSRRNPGSGKDLYKVQDRYMKLLLRRSSPGLQEKLVLFWHDHFATNNAGVGDPKLMSLQNRLLRYHCKGNLKEFVREIGRDVAMVEFLDTQQNHKTEPNENYARELLELFTLGVHDFAGNENYRQSDIVQIARAFSGWRYVPKKYKLYFDSTQHDYVVEFPGRGPKTIFTEVGGFGPAGRAFDDLGEGEPEIDRVVDIVFDHTDTDGENTVARRTAQRLLECFGHGGYADPLTAQPVVDAVVAESNFDVDFEIEPLVRAILVNDAFYETNTAAPHGPTTKRSVKWPIDFVVSTLRMLEIKPKKNRVWGGTFTTLREHASRMGQSLMEPPSVFGWDWENGWVTTGSTLARCAFARDLCTTRTGSKATTLRATDFIDPGLTDPGDIVDAATDRLGLTDQISAPERTALIDYLTTEGGPPLDLSDEDFVDRKLNGLFGLLLQSPAYQVH